MPPGSPRGSLGPALRASLTSGFSSGRDAHEAVSCESASVSGCVGPSGAYGTPTSPFSACGLRRGAGLVLGRLALLTFLGANPAHSGPRPAPPPPRPSPTLQLSVSGDGARGAGTCLSGGTGSLGQPRGVRLVRVAADSAAPLSEAGRHWCTRVPRRLCARLPVGAWLAVPGGLWGVRPPLRTQGSRSPSFPSVWGRACGTRRAPVSGALYGRVRVGGSVASAGTSLLSGDLGHILGVGVHLYTCSRLLCRNVCSTPFLTFKNRLYFYQALSGSRCS